MIIKSLLATKVLNEFCNICKQNLLSEIINGTTVFNNPIMKTFTAVYLCVNLCYVH